MTTRQKEIFDLAKMKIEVISKMTLREYASDPGDTEEDIQFNMMMLAEPFEEIKRGIILVECSLDDLNAIADEGYWKIVHIAYLSDLHEVQIDMEKELSNEEDS